MESGPALEPGQAAPGPDAPGPDPAGAEPAGADPAVAAWRSMTASHAAVCSALEHELGTRHGLGVSDFEVLERLAESDQHKFRAQELAGAVHLSQSALSRLIDRLVKHGLVERCLCDNDRRGIYVILTDAGRSRYTEARPTHRAVLARVLGVRAEIPHAPVTSG